MPAVAGMSDVHEAARRNDVEALRRLLDEDPGLVELRDEEVERQPLHVACEAGAIEAARLLLDRGADVSNHAGDYGTPLILACGIGCVELVCLLLDRAADPSARGNRGETPLIAAASTNLCDYPAHDHLAVVRRLLQDERVVVEARDSRGTALWWTCLVGEWERARVLLQAGADLTVEGRKPPGGYWNVCTARALADPSLIQVGLI